MDDVQSSDFGGFGRASFTLLVPVYSPAGQRAPFTTGITVKAFTSCRLQIRIS
ncbi:hypothetical protein JYU34_017297 [Plutella xylostella]|uniref:Uncharacterized protein n=1 Tax=Plutella xylostella TaxID=51655 RepID=A0ABQ7Q0T6_PLUXY|nr:hypothetical protein JYU34_017297 [Plutella xylostella]